MLKPEIKTATAQHFLHILDKQREIAILSEATMRGNVILSGELGIPLHKAAMQDTLNLDLEFLSNAQNGFRQWSNRHQPRTRKAVVQAINQIPTIEISEPLAEVFAEPWATVAIARSNAAKFHNLMGLTAFRWLEPPNGYPVRLQNTTERQTLHWDRLNEEGIATDLRRFQVTARDLVDSSKHVSWNETLRLTHFWGVMRKTADELRAPFEKTT